MSVLCGFVVRFLVVVVVVVVMVVVMVVVAVSEMVVMVLIYRERERERERLLGCVGRIIGKFTSQLNFTPTIAAAYTVAASANFILFKNEDGTQQTQPT